MVILFYFFAILKSPFSLNDLQNTKTLKLTKKKSENNKTKGLANAN
jgi:hypothetical protein